MNPIKIGITQSARMETILGKAPAISRAVYLYMCVCQHLIITILRFLEMNKDLFIFAMFVDTFQIKSQKLLPSLITLLVLSNNIILFLFGTQMFYLGQSVTSQFSRAQCELCMFQKYVRTVHFNLANTAEVTIIKQRLSLK